MQKSWRIVKDGYHGREWINGDWCLVASQGRGHRSYSDFRYQSDGNGQFENQVDEVAWLLGGCTSCKAVRREHEKVRGWFRQRGQWNRQLLQWEIQRIQSTFCQDADKIPKSRPVQVRSDGRWRRWIWGFVGQYSQKEKFFVLPR